MYRLLRFHLTLIPLELETALPRGLDLRIEHSRHFFQALLHRLSHAPDQPGLGLTGLFSWRLCQILKPTSSLEKLGILLSLLTFLSCSSRSTPSTPRAWAVTVIGPVLSLPTLLSRLLSWLSDPMAPSSYGSSDSKSVMTATSRPFLLMVSMRRFGVSKPTSVPARLRLGATRLRIFPS